MGRKKKKSINYITPAPSFIEYEEKMIDYQWKPKPNNDHQSSVRYSIQYPHSYVRNNIDCTVYLLEIIKKFQLSIPIVYASSSSIYGDNDFKNEPLKATIAVNNYKPKSVYAASKIATENMASIYSKMYNLTMVGLRFFTVYGSFGRPDMALWTFTDRLLNNKKT